MNNYINAQQPSVDQPAAHQPVVDQLPTADAQIQNQTIAQITPKLSLINKIQLYAHFSPQKIIAVALATQGLWGLYTSINFILIDYPVLEQQLQLHLIAQAQINHFANKAIIMAISTVLNIFFAIKITSVQNKIAKKIHTVIGILLFLGNTVVYNYLDQIGSSQWLSQLMIKFINLFTSLF